MRETLYYTLRHFWFNTILDHIVIKTIMHRYEGS